LCEFAQCGVHRNHTLGEMSAELEVPQSTLTSLIDRLIVAHMLEAFAARNGLCKQFQSRNGMRLRTVFCKSAKPQVSTRGDSNSGSTERGAPSQ
jgi:hypothetical protein